jgi:hypothetical protein
VRNLFYETGPEQAGGTLGGRYEDAKAYSVGCKRKHVLFGRLLAVLFIYGHGKYIKSNF